MPSELADEQAIETAHGNVSRNLADGEVGEIENDYVGPTWRTQ